jgi:hypothetical protein
MTIHILNNIIGFVSGLLSRAEILLQIENEFLTQ